MAPSLHRRQRDRSNRQSPNDRPPNRELRLISFEIAPDATAEMLFEVAVGKPGPIGQAVHLFLDEEGVLKKIDLEFESEALPKIGDDTSTKE